ncbi:MAG: chromate efflux transporter [Betaproteobacteria bacterium]|nr:chromate efflux transporter [Betaproteobacteria bacterium]
MPEPRVSLAALAGLLLRIGATSFGAHMALLGAVQKEAVERRRWLTERDWSDILALVSALPGPMAVNAVACLGWRLRGAAGGWVAVLAILAPSALVMTLYALLHGVQAQAPLLRAALSLMPAAVAAIVLAAAWGLRGLALAQAGGRPIALGAALACLASGGREVTWIILAAGGLGLALAWRARTLAAAIRPQALHPALAAAGVALLTLAAAWLPLRDTVAQLFLGFAHVSLFMFGGGYAAVPLFQQLAVEQHGWVSAQTLADAIALSQLTPGPIMTSAGFIGQRAAGLAGNAAALVGMFLPMAVISVLALQSLRGLAAVWWMQGLLQGVRPAALGVIAATGMLLATRMPDPALALPAFGIALFLLVKMRLPTYWLVSVAALAGVGVSGIASLSPGTAGLLQG